MKKEEYCTHIFENYFKKMHVLYEGLHVLRTIKSKSRSIRIDRTGDKSKLNNFEQLSPDNFLCLIALILRFSHITFAHVTCRSRLGSIPTHPYFLLLMAMNCQHDDPDNWLKLSKVTSRNARFAWGFVRFAYNWKKKSKYQNWSELRQKAS